MPIQKSIQNEFKILVKTQYLEQESRPEEQFYFFTYRVQIKNMGSIAAQLMSRHWIIQDAFGKIEEVRGPGVVGVQPKIHPQQYFEYESSCPLSTSSGSMKGFFQMVTLEGDSFTVEIPEFYLIAPIALH